jgi:beta-carotene 3-hydroxylase
MIFLYILLTIATFFFMEFMAWFTHKYVMHGFGWYLHSDHHIRDGRKLERNDFYALIFAVPSILFIWFGTRGGIHAGFYIGLGVALYGLAYFMFHDVYVHRRVNLLGDLSNWYLRATHKAHLDHHKPYAEYNFGFLIAPLRYYREELALRRTPKS